MKKVLLTTLLCVFVCGCGLIQYAEESRRRGAELDKWMQECIDKSHSLVKGMTLKEVKYALCMTDEVLVCTHFGSSGYELYELANSYNSYRFSVSANAQAEGRRWRDDFGYVYGIDSCRFWFKNGGLTDWSFTPR